MNKIILAGFVVFVALVGISGGVSAQNNTGVQGLYQQPPIQGLYQQSQPQYEPQPFNREQPGLQSTQPQEEQPQLNNFQLQLQRDNFPQPIFK